MAMLPAASNRALPVSSARPTPASANTSPMSAPTSSSSTTGSSGTFARRMNDHHDSSPLTCLLSRTAVRSENDSKTMATDEDAPPPTPADSSSWGWRSFSSPSNSANSEPSVKITSATTNAQK